MKFQLLPSTFGSDGTASPRQHLACFIVDDLVAFDAGSLAMGTNETQKRQIRDVVLSHAHLDHIAGLPLYIDDLFATIKRPIQIHATAAVIDTLEEHIFNWQVYPRFSELRNEHGVVLEYRPFEPEVPFHVQHLTVTAIGVNHKVPAVGFIISDGLTTIALTSDTAEIDRFWNFVNGCPKIDAVMVECAFPDELGELARTSFHLTPQKLRGELAKMAVDCPVYVVNIKPAQYDRVIEQVSQLKLSNVQILEVGRCYEF